MPGFLDNARSFPPGLAPDAGERYPCKFPGCDKTFAQVCSAMRHERRCHQFWRSKLRTSSQSDDFACAMDISNMAECYDVGGVDITAPAALRVQEGGQCLWTSGRTDLVVSSRGDDSCGHVPRQDGIEKVSKLGASGISGSVVVSSGIQHQRSVDRL